jgi:hypothetical protein
MKDGRPVPDHSFSLRITDVPPYVNSNEHVGWTTRHANGVFTFEAVPSDTADVSSEVPWAVEHPLACLLSTDPRFRPAMEELRRGGQPDTGESPIDWSTYPAQGHDDIVSFTK